MQPHGPNHLRPKENSLALSTYGLGTVCRKVSSEKLRCPAKSASDQAPAEVYSTFLDNVKKFKDLNALPVDVNYGEHGTVQAFGTAKCVMAQTMPSEIYHFTSRI